LPPGSVDKAFAVNVNVFWVADGSAEVAALRRALRPGGLLCLLYDGGPTAPARVIEGIRAALSPHGFSDATS
jgi:hypothetical protein